MSIRVCVVPFRRYAGALKAVTSPALERNTSEWICRDTLAVSSWNRMSMRHRYTVLVVKGRHERVYRRRATRTSRRQQSSNWPVGGCRRFVGVTERVCRNSTICVVSGRNRKRLAVYFGRRNRIRDARMVRKNGLLSRNVETRM